jgi:hypothetical protein
MMHRTNPTEYSPNAVQMTNGRFSIRGLRFVGNNTPGQIGLDMVATFGMEVEDVEAWACDTGFLLTYCLMGRLKSCFTESCASYGFRLRSGAGVFTNGTVSNSGCNHTVLDQCREDASTGELAQYHIRASSGVRLVDCIAEGGNPVYSIDFAANSSSVKHFEVVNLHHECAPTSAVAKIAMDVGGTAVIDGLWIQNSNLIVIDGTGTGAGTILVRNIPWWPSGSKFKSTDPCWIFEGGVGQVYGSDVDPKDPANWDGGSVPPYSQAFERTVFAGNPATRLDPINGVMFIGGTTIIGSSGLSGGYPTAGWHQFFADQYWLRYGTDANPYFKLARSASGATLSWGAGGASAVDTDLYRAAADNLKTDDRFTAVGGIDTRVVATGSLPAAGASMDGHVLIEDNGTGDRNLIIYAGGQRFRIDGGAAF